MLIDHHYLWRRNSDRLKQKYRLRQHRKRRPRGNLLGSKLHKQNFLTQLGTYENGGQTIL